MPGSAGVGISARERLWRRERRAMPQRTAAHVAIIAPTCGRRGGAVATGGARNRERHKRAVEQLQDQRS